MKTKLEHQSVSIRAKSIFFHPDCIIIDVLSVKNERRPEVIKIKIISSTRQTFTGQNEMEAFIATKRKVINVTFFKERFQPVQFSFLILYCLVSHHLKNRVRGGNWSKPVTFQFPNTFECLV